MLPLHHDLNSPWSLCMLQVLTASQAKLVQAVAAPRALAMLVKRAAARGGARNLPNAKVDAEHLRDNLLRYADSSDKDSFNLQEYESVWSSCKPGLHALACMSPGFSGINPACNFLYSDLKAALTDVFHLHPTLRGKGGAADKAAVCADKLMVILKHVRDVKSEPGSFKTCDMPKYFKDSLEAVLSKVRLGDAAVAQKPRKLVPRETAVSQLSADSHGLPKLSFLESESKDEESKRSFLIQRPQIPDLPLISFPSRPPSRA